MIKKKDVNEIYKGKTVFLGMVGTKHAAMESLKNHPSRKKYFRDETRKQDQTTRTGYVIYSRK